MKKMIIALAWTMMLLPAVTSAAERFALVIGNGGYTGNPLDNPRNDAIDMAAQLQRLGYQVHGGGPTLDLDRLGMERTLRDFAHSLPNDAHALFYYAGHGMATKTDNYLIPINHRLEFQEQLPDRTVSLRSAVDLLSNSNPEGINVVLLDACRDNPLVPTFRSTRQGLQRLVDIPRGIFIGYAADSGQVAADGTGRNGTYTAELLDIMTDMPGEIVEIAHKEVARRVVEKTNGEQFPVSENKVYGNWCFGTCKSIVVESSTPAQDTIDDSKPSIEIKPKPSTWKVVGGVVLGLVAVGLLTSSKSDPPPAGTVNVELTPP